MVCEMGLSRACRTLAQTEAATPTVRVARTAHWKRRSWAMFIGSGVMSLFERSGWASTGVRRSGGWPRRVRPGRGRRAGCPAARSEEHTSELQSREKIVCRLLLEKKKRYYFYFIYIYINYNNMKLYNILDKL